MNELQKKKKKRSHRSRQRQPQLILKSCSTGLILRSGKRIFPLFVPLVPTWERRGEEREGGGGLGGELAGVSAMRRVSAALKLFRAVTLQRERPSARSFRAFRADLLSLQANYDFRNVSAYGARRGGVEILLSSKKKR